MEIGIRPGTPCGHLSLRNCTAMNGVKQNGENMSRVWFRSASVLTYKETLSLITANSHCLLCQEWSQLAARVFCPLACLWADSGSDSASVLDSVTAKTSDPVTTVSPAVDFTKVRVLQYLYSWYCQYMLMTFMSLLYLLKDQSTDSFYQVLCVIIESDVLTSYSSCWIRCLFLSNQSVFIWNVLLESRLTDLFHFRTQNIFLQLKWAVVFQQTHLFHTDVSTLNSEGCLSAAACSHNASLISASYRNSSLPSNCSGQEVTFIKGFLHFPSCSCSCGCWRVLVRENTSFNVNKGSYFIKHPNSSFCLVWHHSCFIIHVFIWYSCLYFIPFFDCLILYRGSTMWCIL